MAEIVIVQAELGGTLVPDGLYPGLMLGGPAGEAVLDLPAWGRFTASVVRLLVDGQPAKYFAVSGAVRPGRPRIYCWDDPSTDTIPHVLRAMLRNCGSLRNFPGPADVLQRRIGEASRA